MQMPRVCCPQEAEQLRIKAMQNGSAVLHSSGLPERAELRRVKERVLQLEGVVLHPEEKGQHLHVVVDVDILPAAEDKREAILNEFLRLHTNIIKVRVCPLSHFPGSVCQTISSFSSFFPFPICFPQCKKTPGQEKRSAKAATGFECGERFAQALGPVADVVRFLLVPCPFHPPVDSLSSTKTLLSMAAPRHTHMLAQSHTTTLSHRCKNMMLS